MVVVSHSTSDERFFPATEPLSYLIDKHGLAIGRNEVCDGYLHLRDELKDFRLGGEYVALNLGGTQQLGYFSLIKDE